MIQATILLVSVKNVKKCHECQDCQVFRYQFNFLRETVFFLLKYILKHVFSLLGRSRCADSFAAVPSSKTLTFFFFWPAPSGKHLDWYNFFFILLDTFVFSFDYFSLCTIWPKQRNQTKPPKNIPMLPDKIIWYILIQI